MKRIGKFGIIKPRKADSMIGAGLCYRGRRFITHSQLDHRQSAIITLVAWQKIFLFILIASAIRGFVLDPQLTAIMIIAVLSTVYFFDVCFNLYLIIKSLHLPPEIQIDSQELSRLDPNKLPTYSILCPLYKEQRVLPQFVKAINKLDWPKDKLDVLLLLEKDDQETIKAARKINLPKHFRIIVIPPSNPQTKPKACNYGLSLAKGKYMVIYDAEDKPDPLQLKKAYLGFAQVPKRVICLQAKLNYYNPHHNLLTKLFTAEYSLWFDVILPGLQSIETIIPLGGTSNHFYTEKLRELHGWDAFNVTEDCDLGVRLFKRGYKTAIIDSVTLEEANSNLKNWIRQRSRWIKGYLQTYFVHLRHPIQFFRDHGRHAFLFHLIVGLKTIFILINPLLWAATISYFAYYSIVGPIIESLYPPLIFYIAAFSLVFGNFMYFYSYMIGCAKRKRWLIIKYVFLVPIYWLTMVLGALLAFVQLIFKPYFWEKTHHGLHLKKEPIVSEKKVPQLVPAGALIGASIVANFLNFLYNAYLGRTISIEEFGLVSLFSSIFYLAQATFGALSQTITHRAAYLLGKYQSPIKEFWKFIRYKTVNLALIITFIWLILTPRLAIFFHADSILPFLLFTPVWFIGTVGAVDSGFLAGNLRFAVLALMLISAALIKLTLAFGLVSLNYIAWIYTAIPGSILVAFLIGWRAAKSLRGTKVVNIRTQKYFPKQFFAASILTSLATVAFLSLDVILVKHYLSPTEAGQYALMALAGKIIFFAGGLFSQFVNPLVSKTIGAGKDTKRVFYRLLSMTTVISLAGFVVIGMFGKITVPFLFGSRANAIVPLLPTYALAMACFTIASSIVTYHQVRKEYLFPIVSFLLAILQIMAITAFHVNLRAVTEIMISVGIGSLIMMAFLHRFYQSFVTILTNLADFFALFTWTPQPQPKPKDKLRILIFNWRDTKHIWAGGAEVYIHEVAKRWVKEEHKVTVFCGNDHQNPRNQVVDGVQIVRRGGFFTVYFWALLYYLLRFRGLFDVVVDCENGIPFFTPLYVRVPTFLIIYHVHQTVFKENLKPPFSWLAIFLEKKLIPIVYKNQQVITISPSSKKAILRNKLTSKAPVVIPGGVDLATYIPGEKAKQPLIVYVGRLKPYKNLTVLMKAIQDLSKRLVLFRLVIVGFGEERTRLEQLVKQFKLENYVEFAGRVSEANKIRFYQQAWVAVNPSSMEGWGITSIEANACGTTMVAANVPGLRDSVKNPYSGFLVDYEDYQAFADRIFRIITNRRLREDLSKKARIWASQFNWNKSAAHYLKIFQS